MPDTREKSSTKGERQILNEGMRLGIVSVVFSLLYGWLHSTGAAIWLHPFLLIGAIIFGLLLLTHLVMMDLIRYGFRR